MTTTRAKVRSRLTSANLLAQGKGAYLRRPHDRAFEETRPCAARAVAMLVPAFTLVELIVVIGIIAVLIAVLMPVLSTARESAWQTQCASNIRQLHLAVQMYANENHGYFVPAYTDFIPPRARAKSNLWRWHGTRADLDSPFDFAGSPLRRYLNTPAIKSCPSFEPAKIGFEASAGGYGYNAAYLGSSTGDFGFAIEFVNKPALLTQIRKPAETIEFTDAAMGEPELIEYSFAEPLSTSTQQHSPSIHFRHRRQFANVVWVDGHVTAERLTFTNGTNVYGADNLLLRLGWFGNGNEFDRQ